MRQDQANQRPAGGPAAGSLSWLLLLPLALYAIPAAVALASRSEVPLVFGRYSKVFFGFNLWSIGVILMLLLSWRRRSHLGLQFAYLALIATTVIVPANNQLRALPWLVMMMPVIRLATGGAMMLTGFDRYRRGLGRPMPAFLGLGAVLLVLSLLDLLLLAVIAAGPEHRRSEAQLRQAYSLGEVGQDDVVLVGDSFVWGQGVGKEERFGDRLEALFHDQGRPTRVFSLGIVGTGPHQYLEMLAEVPPGAGAGRVVVAFYMNDIPLTESLWGKIQDSTVALGRGFPTIRLLGDKLAKLLARDVHAYHAYVVDSYREDHPTFATRWALLERQLADLSRLAAERSARPPLLLILPIMVDFQAYPLEAASERVAGSARAAGFEVLDLLPVFREVLGDADAHRNAADDNHFDAETHDLVARTLYGVLSGAPEDPPPSE
jgi:lysophospholipase L1-like esterase